MADNSRQTITLLMEQEMQQRLKHLADERKTSAHALMLDAIAQYLEREEKRSQFYRHAQESWQEYQTSGQHITAEETRDWLESWGTGQDKDAPECHK